MKRDRQTRERRLRLVQLEFPGLNRADQIRMADIGYKAWFEETCKAQRKRLEQRKRKRLRGATEVLQ